MGQQRLSFWYVIPPLATLVLLLPPVSELPPFWPKGSLNQPGIGSWMAVLPFYVGLCAAPGYLYAWAGNYSRSSLKPWVRNWVEISIVLAILSSLVGGVFSVLTVIVAPFAFWSGVMAVRLWRRFRKS